MPVPSAVRETPLGDEPTDPLAVAEAEDLPQYEAPTEADERGHRRRLFIRRLRRRAVVLPLVCVAALLVGFGTVTAVLRIGDEPAKSDAGTPSTTAAVTVPSPSSVPRPNASAPPDNAAAIPEVGNEPAPAPAPTASPTPAPAPAPRSGAVAPTSPPSSAPPTTTPRTTTPSTTNPAP